MNYKAKMVAVFIATFVTATSVSAESTDWFVVAEGAFQQGGNISRADALGNVLTFSPGRTPEWADNSSFGGRLGIGKQISDKLQATLYVGSSSKLRSTYSANTKPTAPPPISTLIARFGRSMPYSRLATAFTNQSEYALTRR